MTEIEGKTYSLRPATADDLPGILAIENRSYPMPWKEQNFLDELGKGFARFLVLTDDETDSVVAGYTVFWLLFEECHVLNVTVNPEFRGLGIGSSLIRHAMAEATKKEMKRVFLEVRKSNEGAIQLYQRLGFFIDHIKRKFYEDGEDAYFMIRFLERQEPAPSLH